MQNFNTIRTQCENEVATLQIYRPDSDNTINDELIHESNAALDEWQDTAKIVVIEGLPEVFCFGADFKDMATDIANTSLETLSEKQNAGPMYEVWLKLAEGPFITVAKVQGKVNAGGMGFVSACDIVLGQKGSVFSLSELLFSLMPACVLPFLVKKIGFQKAHYLTLMTQPIGVEIAAQIGLVDAVADDVDSLLQRHLRRLKCLKKTGIRRYKNYMNQLNPILAVNQEKAIAANKEVFSDIENLEKITRYVNTGKFPWEED